MKSKTNSVSCWLITPKCYRLLGILFLAILVVSCKTTFSSENKSRSERRLEQTEKVQRMIEEQNYRFVAQQALPAAGRAIILTSGYDLKVTQNLVNAHLPYFGRAYVAPMNPLDGGIRFESKDFDYKLENANRDGWTANIVINDSNRRIELSLNIATNGSANLLVIENTRQNISFRGQIVELETEELQSP
jgi:hypothetical protein